MKKIIRLYAKKTYTIPGLLLVGAILCVIFASILLSRNDTSARRNDIPSSHSTGRLVIDFKKGTTYQQTQEVFKKLNLTNSREDFMQPNILVKDPTDRVWSPVEELNAFQALLEKLAQTPEVNRFDYAQDAIRVYFEPNVSEKRAREVLEEFKLTILPGVNFQINYSATVKVPKGEELQYIKSLYEEKSVERAGEPILTTQ